MKNDPELLKNATDAFAKAPQEELIALYSDTILQFALIRPKLYSKDENEQQQARIEAEALKESVKEKMRTIYRNVGVDFDSLIDSFLKKVNKTETEIII